jgi:hypothetical protein
VDKITHALSTDCGKGWVSKEEYEHLSDALNLLNSQYDELNLKHIRLQAKYDAALADWHLSDTRLSLAVDGLGIIHSHFVVHTQVCADKSCWKCYIGKLAAQILDKIEE